VKADASIHINDKRKEAVSAIGQLKVHYTNKDTALNGDKFNLFKYIK